jgi:hypothetical protein
MAAIDASRCLIGPTSGDCRRPPMDCVPYLVAVHARLTTLPDAAVFSARTTAMLCCKPTVRTTPTPPCGLMANVSSSSFPWGRRGVPLPQAIIRRTGTTSSCFVRRSCDPAPRCPWRQTENTIIPYTGVVGTSSPICVALLFQFSSAASVSQVYRICALIDRVG